MCSRWETPASQSREENSSRQSTCVPNWKTFLVAHTLHGWKCWMTHCISCGKKTQVLKLERGKKEVRMTPFLHNLQYHRREKQGGSHRCFIVMNSSCSRKRNSWKEKTWSAVLTPAKNKQLNGSMLRMPLSHNPLTEMLTKQSWRQHPALLAVAELYNEMSSLRGIDMHKLFLFPHAAAKVVSQAVSNRKKNHPVEISSILSQYDSKFMGKTILWVQDVLLLWRFQHS